MKLLKSISLLSIFYGVRVLACEPVQPTIIPPSTLDGEFQSVYPDYQKEVENSVRNARNLAVVKVIGDSSNKANDGRKVAVAILELLYGWGYQSGRYMKYVRKETSCGKPEKISESGWHVALLHRNEVDTVIPYSSVEEQVKSRGKPEYVYSSIGLIMRRDDNKE